MKKIPLILAVFMICAFTACSSSAPVSTPAPAAELRYAVYPWVVECTALRAAGWRPSYDNPAALAQLLEAADGHRAVAGRRITRKETAITAASAAASTAAVIGTAAYLHSRRTRRHAPDR